MYKSEITADSTADKRGRQRKPCWGGGKDRRLQGEQEPAIIFIPYFKYIEAASFPFVQRWGTTEKCVWGISALARSWGRSLYFCWERGRRRKRAIKYPPWDSLQAHVSCCQGARLQCDTSSSLSSCQTEYVWCMLYMWEVVTTSLADHSFKTQYNGAIVWD